MLGDFRLRQPIIFLLDLMYMLTLTVGISVFSYAFNFGTWRLFMLIPMGVGFAVYYNTVGRLVMLFSETLIRWIRTVLHYVVVIPICFVLRCLKIAGLWIIRHTIGVLVKRIVESRRKSYTDKQKRMLKNLIRI